MLSLGSQPAQAFQNTITGSAIIVSWRFPAWIRLLNLPLQILKNRFQVLAYRLGHLLIFHTQIRYSIPYPYHTRTEGLLRLRPKRTRYSFVQERLFFPCTGLVPQSGHPRYRQMLSDFLRTGFGAGGCFPRWSFCLLDFDKKLLEKIIRRPDMGGCAGPTLDGNLLPYDGLRITFIQCFWEVRRWADA